MTLFLAVFIMELAVMITLIKWRMKQKKGEVIDLSPARSFAFISHLQLGLIVIMVLIAVIMSRGLW